MKSILDLPQTEARRLLSKGAPVYLAINPVEYHGPHLSLHNDALISQGLIRDMHDVLRREGHDWPLLSAGELDVGVGTTPGPGSRPMRFRIVCEIVRRTCSALADLGARRVVLMTFHGGPLHSVAIERGVELLVKRGVHAVAPFNALFDEIIHRDGGEAAEAYEVVEDEELRHEMIRNSTKDLHAGFGETSLTLHYAPKTVGDYRALAPCPAVAPDPRLSKLAALFRGANRVGVAEELDLLAGAKAWMDLQPFPGYTGRPNLADPKSGVVFARVISERYARIAQDVFAGKCRSPRPAYSWLEKLTLGGRLELSGD